MRRDDLHDVGRKEGETVLVPGDGVQHERAYLRVGDQEVREAPKDDLFEVEKAEVSQVAGHKKAKDLWQEEPRAVETKEQVLSGIGSIGSRSFCF
mmetsp:Transcript_19246/g.44572  ORF Transcript_19246/g.44572 Transcript_19246/m.44572 type:complete len:95 (-) Transcript_19246:324-608(-)